MGINLSSIFERNEDNNNMMITINRGDDFGKSEIDLDVDISE